MEDDPPNTPHEVREPPPGYKTQSEDTSFAAEQYLFERWATMPPHEKAKMIEQMVETVRHLSRVGVGYRHPNADEQEIEMRARVLWLGPELVKKVYGWEAES